MTFAHPWLLLGALAALIPVLVHLFDRRRPRPEPFAAISFVLRSQRRTASRLKLRRLLLYVLRTLILLALPVALARPELVREKAVTAAHGPAATAIVLDASLSMRYRDGARSLFEVGQDEARAALRELSQEEPATFVRCSADAPAPSSLTFDRRGVRDAIDEAQASYGPADLGYCLELAARALEESPLPGKRLVVISDFAGSSLRLEAPAPMVSGPKGDRVRPEVMLRDVAPGRELPNRTITEVKVEPAVQVGPRTFQYTATVRNYSSQPAKDLEVQLKVGGKVVAKGFVDLAPQGTAQKVLTHRFESTGPQASELALPPDGLVEDDHVPLVVEVPKALRALVVNGAPSTVRYRDEAFFVDAALTAPGSPVRSTLRDFDSALKEDFGSYDVVLLLNVAAPTDDVAARLKAFVEKGGGVFISMGENVDPEAWNQRLGALLPRPLRLVRTSADPAMPEAEGRASHLSQVLSEHPIFTPFVGRAGEGLTGARFFRYMLLEGATAGPGQGARPDVLAAFEDGAPAMAEARRGAGRVLLFASSVDRDWADLAIRTSFLPLMQRVCAYLGGALEEHEELRARVGQPLQLKPNAVPPPAVVLDPSGAEVRGERAQDGALRLRPLALPGVYSRRDGKGEATPLFAVTVDPSESDLSRLKPEDLSAHFGEGAVLAAAGMGAEARVPFWTWLIVTAALAFFLEGVLLRK